MLNGTLVSDISIMDRGFQYGDGLFETLSISKGVVSLWDHHYSRLEKSCQRLSIAVPDKADLLNNINMLMEGIDTENNKYVVKLMVSRGVSGRGYAVTDSITPNVVLILSDYPGYPESYGQTGVKTRICDLKLSHQPLLAGMKHLNRLEQVLARNEWNSTDIVEGLVCDQNNNVIEGIMSNVFIVDNDKVLTPKLDQCGVEGVMRRHVLEYLDRKNIETEINNINQEQLFSASEVFLTNSIIGIWPVRKIDARVYSVGPITRLLQDRLVK